MKNVLQIALFMIIVFLLSGCGITRQIVGEYYLDEKKYDRGVSHFKKRVNENPNSAESNYYYGRFLLAKNKANEALPYIQKAIQLDSKKSIYHSWLGVTYAFLKKPQLEKQAYLKALELDENNIQALTYLAHNYYEKKQYSKALENYNKVLKISSSNQYALYNRASTLKKLKRIPEEKNAWLKYLEYYPAGSFARNAVSNLNKMNNFEYKNHLIGFKTVTLKNIEFTAFTSSLTKESKPSLDLLGEILKKDKKISIHIIAYQLNNKTLAKQKAKEIKKYILKNYKKIDPKRLKLSWFNQSKKFKIGRKNFRLNETIDFITVVNK